MEENFSKENPSLIRTGSMEGENLVAGGDDPFVNPVSVQAPAPTLSPKVPSFSACGVALHVISATIGVVVVASKSLPSSHATSFQSSGSFSKVVTPVVRVKISDSQPKKKVVISLGIFSFNAMPPLLRSAQSVSIAPVRKAVGPPPSSPD